MGTEPRGGHQGDVGQSHSSLVQEVGTDVSEIDAEGFKHRQDLDSVLFVMGSHWRPARVSCRKPV